MAHSFSQPGRILACKGPKSYKKYPNEKFKEVPQAGFGNDGGSQLDSYYNVKDITADFTDANSETEEFQEALDVLDGRSARTILWLLHHRLDVSTISLKLDKWHLTRDDKILLV